jgi:ketosteroid isomerase-like protein
VRQVPAQRLDDRRRQRHQFALTPALAGDPRRGPRLVRLFEREAASRRMAQLAGITKGQPSGSICLILKPLRHSQTADEVPFPTKKEIPMIRLLMLAIAVGFTVPVFAQDRSADEKALRELIVKLDAQNQAEPIAPDAVRWTGAQVRPYVQGQRAEPRPGLAVGAERVNQKQTYKVERLKIAPSGDMAYEYSNFVLTYDRKDTGRSERFEGALLRVWEKVKGQWRVAAWFQQPYNTAPLQ